MMPIDFFTMLDDQGWEPLVFEVSNPNLLWIDGGLLADAPVDVAATFDGAMWCSTRIEPQFRLRGFRCRPGFTIPLHHCDQRLQVIVIAGRCTVGDGSGGEPAVVQPGQFWVTDAGTPRLITAGPDGVTYIESIPLKETAEPTLTWHNVGWISR